MCCGSQEYTFPKCKVPENGIKSIEVITYPVFFIVYPEHDVWEFAQGIDMLHALIYQDLMSCYYGRKIKLGF